MSTSTGFVFASPDEIKRRFPEDCRFMPDGLRESEAREDRGVWGDKVVLEDGTVYVSVFQGAGRNVLIDSATGRYVGDEIAGMPVRERVSLGAWISEKAWAQAVLMWLQESS